MKGVSVILCLSAMIALSFGQYTLTPTLIFYRNQIVNQNYASYQKIDASFFKLYNALRVTTDAIYKPFTGIYDDFNSAFEKVDLDKLSLDTASNFTRFTSEINSTLYFNKNYLRSMSLSMFSMSMMGPEYLTPTASSFKNSLYSISSLLMRASYPTVSDECVKLTLSQIVPTYKPFVQELVDLADNAIQQIPTVFANATTIARVSFVELRSLINKINGCARSASINICIDQLNQQNSNCNQENSCLALKAVSKPQIEVNNAVMAIQQIYPSYMMPNMGFNDKIQELSKICLDPPTAV